MKSRARVAVGIDLGTTNSVGAFCTADGDVKLAETLGHERLTPSEVFVARDGTIVVGRRAQREGARAPERHFQHMKRDLGDPDASRALDGRVYSPVLLSSFVLRSVVEDLVRAGAGPVDEAVVTVPAYFGDLERGATLDAARIAGIAHVPMLNEPTAAALAFGFDPDVSDAARKLAVYDLGGGTFDVTLAEVSRGRVRVLATAGEHHLGGKDWDDELVNLLAEEAVERAGKDPREDFLTLARLRARAERAKHALSTDEEAKVEVALPGEKKPLELVVARAAFEARTRGLLEQTRTQLEQALEKAKLDFTDVDAVLLVGGATRMPMVQDLIRRVSGKAPRTLDAPEEAVARGAALYARLLARGRRLDDEVERANVAPRPKRKSPVLSSASDIAGPEEEGQEELPLLPGECRVPEVQDVVSHALGVLVIGRRGGRNIVLLPEQSPVPVERTRRFFTIRDDQTAVAVKVLEGQDEDPDGCRLIGTVLVDGLPAGRARGQAIDITYRYDEDGRIQVNAKDVATGRAVDAVIERKGELAPDEVARLRKLAAEKVRA